MKTKKITVQGVEIDYYDTETGIPLLLIHGLSMKEGFLLFLDNPDPSVRLIVPELPGLENSPGDLFNYNYDNIIDFLKEFMSKLGLNKFSIFGNSIGGTFALLFATRYPYMADKLIIRSPLFTSKQLPWYYKSPILVNFYEYLSNIKMLRPFFRSIFTNIFKSISSLEHSDKNHINTIIELQKEQTSFQALRSILLQLARTNITSILPNIKTKTLILWPEKDEILNIVYANKIASLLPNCELKIEKGVYHNILSEDPKLFIDEVKEFLEIT